MDTPESNEGDRFPGAALAPFWDSIKKDIRAVVDIGVVMQIGQKDIVRHYRPLMLIKSRETFKVRQQINIRDKRGQIYLLSILFKFATIPYAKNSQNRYS